MGLMVGEWRAHLLAYRQQVGGFGDFVHYMATL